MEDLTKYSLDQLLESYLKALAAQEELEASISVIKNEMIQRLDEENLKGTIVGDYSVSKVIRVNFRPTLEQAKELAAIKTVETIDTQALKRLHDSGVEIPNTTTTTFVLVKPLQKEE